MVYFNSIEEVGFDTGFLDFDIEVVTTNTYDEFEIKKTIEQSNEKELLAASIQLAVVGWGNQTYGSVKVDGTEKTLEDIFVENHVFYANSQGLKMKPNELTPKRLCRYFRFHISKWLLKNSKQTYLMRKYGNRQIRQYSHVVFPGAEYMVVNTDHVNALLTCYCKLDERQHTSFVPRMEQILESRGVELPVEEEEEDND